MENRPNVVVIVGPTAVGKTKLSIDIAKWLGTDIVSADSMQIYKHMDIGTAKPSQEEMQGIRHYLIDEIEPGVDFSVAQYKELAENYLDKIISESKTPVLIGGTGLYINSVISNVKFSETQSDEVYRNQLLIIAQEKGNEYIHEVLKEVDPDSALKLHPNDLRRIIRALEVYKATGVPISKHQEQSMLEPSRYRFIIVGLDMERELLYQRINKRVDLMIEQGLIDEVKKLVSMGYNSDNTSMQAIGYKEILEYLNGNCSLQEAMDTVKQESRRYAKRQFTWFRRNDKIRWIDVTQEDYKNILKNVKEYIAQNLETM